MKKDFAHEITERAIQMLELILICYLMQYVEKHQLSGPHFANRS